MKEDHLSDSIYINITHKYYYYITDKDNWIIIKLSLFMSDIFILSKYQTIPKSNSSSNPSFTSNIFHDFSFPFFFPFPRLYHTWQEIEKNMNEKVHDAEK